MNLRILAIIPARGGSKRLHNKNILNLCDKPLLSYTIDAALKSKYITKTIVSSDDNEILKIAEKYGSNIIKRPKNLSLDNSTSFDTVIHTIDNENTSYDYIILLQPTSPLRTTEHIDQAIQLLINKNADAVISLCECEHSPLWSHTLPKNNTMNDFVTHITDKRSQDLKKHYRLNGAIYIAKTDKLISNKSFLLSKNIFAYIMPQEDSIDIDTQLDLLICETILKNPIKK